MLSCNRRILRAFRITILVILLLVLVGQDSFQASVLTLPRSGGVPRAFSLMYSLSGKERRSEASLGLLATNKVDCYAVLICAASEGNPKKHPNLDPIDVNAGIIALSKMYATLTGCGYKDENVFIFYCAGLEPGWSEQFNKEYIQQIKKKHFSGKYNNGATQGNINSIIASLKSKIDDNDRFIFYVLGHGTRAGTVQLSRGMWSSQNIQSILGGFKSKTNIFLFDNCFGGAILNKTSFDNAVCFSATSAQTPGWIDRTFSNCANFLEHKANKKNDKNKDGIVDYDEAFEATEKFAREYEPELREYIRTKYKGRSGHPSLIPVIKAGNSYVKANLGTKSGGGGGKEMGCDLKGAKKVPICTACGKTLLGYRCLDCKKMFALDEGADKKCPDCGSAKLSSTKLVVEKKCFFCKGPIKEEQMCVKKVYSCPNHPDMLHLKPVRCSKCKKKLELKETVSSKAIIYYECRKCGHMQGNSGKCPDCKKTLKRKRKCEKSGTFPHVNEREWKKQHK